MKIKADTEQALEDYDEIDISPEGTIVSVSARDISPATPEDLERLRKTMEEEGAGSPSRSGR